MKLSIIIPCYNEYKSLPLILKKVQDVKLMNNLEKEIIVVDDGSTDGSREYLMRNARSKIKIIYHEKNMGKGAALRTGLKYAKGDIIIFQDADLELDPQEYNNLLQPLLNENYEAVYGSRFLKQHKASSVAHYLGNRFLTSLTRILYNAKITDMETCYKLFRKEIIKKVKLKSNDFSIEPEITAKILKKGIRIKEVPVTYNPRTKKDGKKMKWRHGFTAIWTLLYLRFKD
jgi:glycosyltransferase involved in cell wall biosynthesis